ncbi:MAG: hypothetical protein ACI4T9_12355, partial [Prevotella sp.]
IRVRQQQGRALTGPPLLLSYIDMNLRNINHKWLFSHTDFKDLKDGYAALQLHKDAKVCVIGEAENL